MSTKFTSSLMLGISLVVSTDWTAHFGVMFPAIALLVAVGLRTWTNDSSGVA